MGTHFFIQNSDTPPKKFLSPLSSSEKHFSGLPSTVVHSDVVTVVLESPPKPYCTWSWPALRVPVAFLAGQSDVVRARTDAAGVVLPAKVTVFSSFLPWCPQNPVVLFSPFTEALREVEELVWGHRETVLELLWHPGSLRFQNPWFSVHIALFFLGFLKVFLLLTTKVIYEVCPGSIQPCTMRKTDIY